MPLNVYRPSPGDLHSHLDEIESRLKNVGQMTSSFSAIDLSSVPQGSLNYYSQKMNSSSVSSANKWGKMPISHHPGLLNQSPAKQPSHSALHPSGSSSAIGLLSTPRARGPLPGQQVLASGRSRSRLSMKDQHAFAGTTIRPSLQASSNSVSPMSSARAPHGPFAGSRVPAHIHAEGTPLAASVGGSRFRDNSLRPTICRTNTGVHACVTNGLPVLRDTRLEPISTRNEVSASARAWAAAHGNAEDDCGTGGADSAVNNAAHFRAHAGAGPSPTSGMDCGADSGAGALDHSMDELPCTPPLFPSVTAPTAMHTTTHTSSSASLSSCSATPAGERVGVVGAAARVDAHPASTSAQAHASVSMTGTAGPSGAVTVVGTTSTSTAAAATAPPAAAGIITAVGPTGPLGALGAVGSGSAVGTIRQPAPMHQRVRGDKPQLLRVIEARLAAQERVAATLAEHAGGEDIAPRTRALFRAHMAALASLAEGLPTYAPLLEAALSAVHAYAEEGDALIALIPALKAKVLELRQLQTTPPTAAPHAAALASLPQTAVLQQQLEEALARNQALAARAERAEAQVAQQSAELAKLEGVKESRDRLLRRLQRAEEERKSLFGLGQDGHVGSDMEYTSVQTIEGTNL